MAWSPHARTLALGDASGFILLVDSETGECKLELKAHKKAILSVVWRPDGRTVVIGSKDGSAALWDTETEACTCTMEDPAKHGWFAGLPPALRIYAGAIMTMGRLR